MEQKQELVVARGDWRWQVAAAPAPQQGCLLAGPIEGCQMVEVTGLGQAVGLFQFQVQEEHLDPVARRQADGPVAPDVVGVGAGVLWAGEVAPHGRVHLLAFPWGGGGGRSSGEKDGDCRFLQPQCEQQSLIVVTAAPWQIVGTMARKPGSRSQSLC